MALNPKDRYPTARALAEDVQRWLADEPVTAHQESRGERLARWMRRNRARVQSTIIALVIITLVALAASFFIYQAKEDEAEARRVAETARQTAEEAQAKEEVERLKAEENKRKAIANFRRARDAVDTFLTGPAADLEGYPGVSEFRARILRRAAEDYDELAKQSSDDMDIELERGRTLLRLGQLYFNLDDLTEAEKSYRQADAVFASLGTAYPQNQTCRFERTQSLNEVGTVLSRKGKHQEADESYQAAIDNILALISDNSKPEHRYHAALGVSLTNRGTSLLQQDAPAEADTLLRQALSEFEKAFAMQPTEADYRRSLSHVLKHLGTTLRTTGAYDEAERLCRRAIDYGSALVKEQPRQLDFVEALGESKEFLADLLVTQGKLDESLSIYDTLIQDYDQLVGSSDGVPRYKEALARAHNQRGELLYRLERTSDAEEELKTAVDGFAALVDQRATPLYLEQWATALDNLGQLLSGPGTTG